MTNCKSYEVDWIKFANSAKQMFKVFLVMRQLHELLWYLTETLTLQETTDLDEKINYMFEITESYTRLSPETSWN